MNRKAVILATVAAGALLAVPVASSVTLVLGNLWQHPYYAEGLHWLWSWFPMREQWAGSGTMSKAAIAMGGIAGAMTALAAPLVAWRSTKRPFGGRRWGADDAAVERSERLNYGTADWMERERAMTLFPEKRSDTTSRARVVMGEAVRMDLERDPAVSYHPRRPETWAPGGGSTPLLIDWCETGSTHSLIIGASGRGHKTAELVTRLLVWGSSMVVHDPARELCDMLRPAIEAQGRRVIVIEPGGEGINPLAHLDPEDPDMPAKLGMLVSDIVGAQPTGAGDSKSENTANRFNNWGRDVITCLLAHMVSTVDLEPHERTLALLRYSLTEGGIPGLIQRLEDVAAASPSEYARSIAATFTGWPEEQFAGVYGVATGDTEWLEHDGLSGMVSSMAFDPADLLDGNTVVFVQIPRVTLIERPAVGRVVIGALMARVFAAEGAVQDRVGFFIDEAALLGSLRIIEVVRDEARKYGITMQLIYQSEQQIERIWGKGWQAWYDSVSWRSYGTIQSPDTAKRLSDTLGHYTAVAVSSGENKGKSSRALELFGTNNKGENVSTRDEKIPLMWPHEILQEVEQDERIVVVAGDRPIRCRAAIGYQRPEVEALLKKSRFGKRDDAAA